MNQKSQELFEAAFCRPRDPRSAEYKAGILAALKYRLGETDTMPCPYPVGSVQLDAWLSGTNEGHMRARASMGTLMPK